MTFAERVTASRFGWAVAPSLIGLIYLGAILFDHFIVISLPTPCGEADTCTWTNFDGFSGGATIYPLTSTKDLDISGKFTSGLLFSAVAAAITLAFQRSLAGRAIDIWRASRIFAISYLIETAFLTGYLIWFALTQEYVTIYFGSWEPTQHLAIAAHILPLTIATMAAAAMLFPTSSSSFQDD